MGPRSAEFAATSTAFGPTLAVHVPLKCRPGSAHVPLILRPCARNRSTPVSQDVAKFSRTWPEVARVGTNPDRGWPDLARGWPDLSSTPGRGKIQAAMLDPSGRTTSCIPRACVRLVPRRNINQPSVAKFRACEQRTMRESTSMLEHGFQGGVPTVRKKCSTSGPGSLLWTERMNRTRVQNVQEGPKASK